MDATTGLRGPPIGSLSDFGGAGSSRKAPPAPSTSGDSTANAPLMRAFGSPPTLGTPRHSFGSPAAGRRGPWPAPRRSPVGGRPATASLRPGSTLSWRYHRDHQAG